MTLQRRLYPTPNSPLNYWKYCLSKITNLDLVSYYWKQGLSNRLTGFELCQYTIDSVNNAIRSLRYQPYQSPRSPRSTHPNNVDELAYWLRNVQISQPPFDLDDLTHRLSNL